MLTLVTGPKHGYVATRTPCARDDSGNTTTKLARLNPRHGRILRVQVNIAIFYILYSDKPGECGKLRLFALHSLRGFAACLPLRGFAACLPLRGFAACVFPAPIVNTRFVWTARYDTRPLRCFAATRPNVTNVTRITSSSNKQTAHCG